MKKLTVILLAIMVTVFSCNTAEKEAAAEAEGFVIKRGLNTSHWLSQTEIRGEEREAYMQAVDFAKIAEMGFDHVRIPVDEMHLWDEDGNKHEDAFKLLHNAINWSFDNDLRVIVDLHVLRSHHFNTGNQRLWTDPEAQQQEYYEHHNALSLIENLPADDLKSIRWFIDCGDDDFLYEGNSLVHIALKKKNIPHEYRVRDGVHSWTYWRASLPVVLGFVSDKFHQY